MAAIPAPPGGHDDPSGEDGRRTTRRVLLVAGILLLVLLGGCATLLVVGGTRAFESLSAPIDVANDYLDAVRLGAEATEFACRPEDPPHPAVPTSQGQYLDSVEINGRTFAEVRGSLTSAEGVPSRVTIDLRRAETQWCVHAVELEGS